MEGYLEKWTNYVFGWKKRFFVLKNNVLYYYLEQGERPKGRIHLGIVSVNDPEPESNGFELDTGLSIVYLKMDTLEEKKKWLQAVRQAKAEVSREKDRRSLGDSKDIGSPDCNVPFSKRSFVPDGANPMTHRLSNNGDNMFSNRVSNLTEDKLNQKLSNLEKIYNELHKNNENLSSLIEKAKDSNNRELYVGLYKLQEKYNNETDKLNLVGQDLNTVFMRFSRDFGKLADYFNNDANEFEIRNIISMNNNNHNEEIGVVKSKAVKANHTKETFYDEMNFNSENNKFKNMDVYKSQNNEIFYGAPDEDEDDLVSNYNKIITQSKLTSERDVVLHHTFHNDMNLDLSISNHYKNDHKSSQFYDPMYNEKRDELPVKKKPLNLNVWSILKDAIGKDLNRFCVPVYFNEPLSMLQRLCENVQYASCLTRAAHDSNPYIRLALIAAYCIGGFSLHPDRTLKFFNPLLGETYEYIDNNQKVRYFSEQVSHHPAISAFHIEGEDFSFYGNSHAKNKFEFFHGRMNFQPIGRNFVYLNKFDEKIAFTKPKAIVNNLMFGKMNIDCGGDFKVENLTTGDVLNVTIHPRSSKLKGKIDGQVKDMIGNVLLRLDGNYLSHMDVIYVNENGEEITERIWERKPIDKEFEENYYFSDFVVNLNLLSEEMKEKLPHTDSRFRPDQRALESGNLDLAASEKHRLEEKQRVAKRERDAQHIEYSIKYFNETIDELTGEKVYLYNNRYWEDREKKNFEHLPEIF